MIYFLLPDYDSENIGSFYQNYLLEVKVEPQGGDASERKLGILRFCNFPVLGVGENSSIQENSACWFSSGHFLGILSKCFLTIEIWNFVSLT